MKKSDKEKLDAEEKFHFKKDSSPGIAKLLLSCVKNTFEYRWFSLFAAVALWAIFLWGGIYGMIAGHGGVSLVWAAVGLPPAIVLFFIIRYCLCAKMFGSYKLDLLVMGYRNLMNKLENEFPDKNPTSADPLAGEQNEKENSKNV